MTAPHPCNAFCGLPGAPAPVQVQHAVQELVYPSRPVTAAEVKLRAERKAGERLAEMPKQHGARPADTESRAVTDSPPTLTDLGISKMQSSRWQVVVAEPRLG